MDENMARTQVTETGRFLLKEGLTARTWGNISCRKDEEHFIITPSGLSYTETKEEDLAVCKLDLSEWTGPRKPSSEKGVHAAAYECFPEVNFVIHTHQPYASALAVYLPQKLDITEEEKEKLGGIGIAPYGLPGMKKLKKGVRAEMAKGNHVVFMSKHGVVIAARDHDEALEKAKLLEEICERNCKKIPPMKAEDALPAEAAKELLAKAKEAYPLVAPVETEAVLARADAKRPIKAQLDDMGQMMGTKVPIVPADGEAIIKSLKKHNAILVPGLGGLVYGKDADDTEAMVLLLTKAAIAANHTDESGAKAGLGFVDVHLQHFVYQKKYSKLKTK